MNCRLRERWSIDTHREDHAFSIDALLLELLGHADRLADDLVLVPAARVDEREVGAFAVFHHGRAKLDGLYGHASAGRSRG